MAADRILIVSHSYAPRENPRALRWASIAQHWAAGGTHVDVITAYQPELDESELLNGVSVYRVGKSIVEQLRCRFHKSHAASPPSRHGTTLKPSRAIQSLRWLHDHTWKRIYWPDYACLWIRPASRAICELASRWRYDAIISVSDPYSGHVATARALQQTPHTNWLVDMGDPFSYRELAAPNNKFLYSALNRRIESRILSQCSALSVTTVATAEEYRQNFPEVASKIHVIGPLFSAPQLKPTKRRPDHSRDSKTLVYVGTLYPELRSPDQLLLLFKELVRTPEFGHVELHFYGGSTNSSSLFDQCKDLRNKNLFVHGVVPREQSLDAMLSADILVNIGNSSPIQLPSKLVEYVWAGRPILNIASHQSDSAADYLKGYPSHLNLFTRPGASDSRQVAQLADFIRSADRPLPASALDLIRERSRAGTIAQQYAAALATETILSHASVRSSSMISSCQ